MTDNSTPSLPRGWPAQRPRREAECATRRHVVDFDHWTQRLGLGHQQAAEYLHLAPGTLAEWQRRWRQDHLTPQRLGRPARRSDVASRNAAIELMDSVGPRLGLPALHRAFPDMAHRELENLQHRFRRLWRLQNRHFGHVLHWHQPGAAWAMDHAEPPQPIDGQLPYILAVRDLASGYQLAWLPVPDETAQTTIYALQWLFLEHGPPLVLKSDNGPGFIADDTRTFLDRWQVWPLFSPPYLPEYNGAIEAGNGSLKNWTHQQAARAGRSGQWTADDCEAARCMANELTYPGGGKPTRKEAWRHHQRPTREDRTAFGRALHKQRERARQELNYPVHGDLSLPAQAALVYAARKFFEDCRRYVLCRTSLAECPPAHCITYHDYGGQVKHLARIVSVAMHNSGGQI